MGGVAHQINILAYNYNYVNIRYNGEDMKLILAQGNPGQEYSGSRHNVGWQVVDAVARQNDTEFRDTPKFHAQLAQFVLEGEKVILVKPTTFYNETGRSLTAFKQFYKLENDDILVIHDELALPFATLRIRQGGSDAGNNGIKNINVHAGESTWRLRIGIQTPLRERAGDMAFVLSRFSLEEQRVLDETIIPKCTEVVRRFITNDHEITSHTLVE